MGRLFWKFFFAFFLVQVVVGVGVGFTFSLFHEQRLGEPRPGPDPNGAASGGMRLQPPPGPLGFRDAPGIGPMPNGPPDGPPVPRPGGPPLLPLLPVVAALLGSLGASGLLAWYFAKPVRNLRWALRTVAGGHLETRVAGRMGGRRDEIADLGRDFDLMVGQLARLMDSQRRLLHDVSHELRSPLARLHAAIGLARQDPAKIATSYDRIERESQRLDSLVGQLLTLSRLDAGADSEPEQRLDAMELLAAAVDDACFEAQSNDRSLHFVGEGVFLMALRPELLHRAFENVLRNAVKFTAVGTTVEVSADLTPVQLRISVCDRGPGVLEAELATIFEPFHRGRNGSGKEGFGLGLAIAQRAVAAHGGQMRAANRAGGGLCLEILLPSR